MYKKFQNFRQPNYTGNPLGWAVRNREKGFCTVGF